MGSTDVYDVENWLNRDLRYEDFLKIFNISSPEYDEVKKSIIDFKNLISEYLDYLEYLNNDKTKEKKQRLLSVLFEDVSGEIAVSIKLASEGYIKQSLRGLRSIIDLLIAGLFASTSWITDHIEDSDSVNPIVKAFSSGLCDRMEVMHLDDLLASRISAKEKIAEVPAVEALSAIASNAGKEFIEKVYEEHSIDRTKYEGKVRSRVRQVLLSSYLTIFRDEYQEIYSSILDYLLSPQGYIWNLINDTNFSLRACEDHEPQLHDHLADKLKLSKRKRGTFKEAVESLSFEYVVEEGGEDTLPKCDECEKRAIYYAFWKRPNNRAMFAIIKRQLPEGDLSMLNQCINSVLEKEANSSEYFGSTIYSKLYVSLNNFVHSNVVDVPDIGEWYGDYMKPVLEINRCIFKAMSGPGKESKKTQIRSETNN